MTTAAEYKLRIADAMSKGFAAQDMKAALIDLSEWPVDVTDIVQRVCELWNLVPPRQKKDKAYWIQSARSLNDSCAEFGLTCLDIYRGEFEQYMAGHGGVARHPVCGPGSLVNMVRDCAGRLRAGTVMDKKKDASYYLEDIYAQFTEH